MEGCLTAAKSGSFNVDGLIVSFLILKKGKIREGSLLGQSLTVAPSLLLTPFLCECSALLFVALLPLATGFGFSLRHRVE